MLGAFQQPPTFSAGLELSAYDLNTLKSNALLVNGASRRSMVPMVQQNFFQDFPIIAARPACLLFIGGFRFLTGMTSAKILYNAAGVSGNGKIRISFNGTIVYNSAVVNNTVQTLTIAINALGYANNSIIYVEIEYYSSPYTYGDKRPTYIYIVDAYVTPLSACMSTTYPGVTTLTNINATPLNSIGDSQIWLVQRLALVPYNFFTGIKYFPGTHKAETYELLHFNVSPTNGNNILKGTIDIICANTQSYIAVTINGTTTNYGPYAYKQSASIALNLNLTTLGCAANSDYSVSVTEVCNTGNPVPPNVNSRISIYNVRLEGNADTWPTIPVNSTPLESLVYSSLLARINQIGALVTDAKTRIDNNTKVFDRMQMFRGKTIQLYEHNERVGRGCLSGQIRRGDVLYVRGTNVDICWGAISVKVPEDNAEKWTLEFEHKESLIGGETDETKLIYLNNYKGLYPGVLYYITGTSVKYASEFVA